MTKDQILERYLNIASFGNGAYGIFAASQVYFGKQPEGPDASTRPRCSPAWSRPRSTSTRPTTERQPAGRRPAQLRDRRDGGDRRDHRRSRPTRPRRSSWRSRASARRTAASATSTNHWGFFCDYFYRWWMEQETFGATTYDRERRLKSGGYTHRHLAGHARRRTAAKTNIEQHAEDRQQATRMMLAARRAGHRPGAGAGGQPQLQARRPGQAAEQDLHQPGEGERRASGAPTRTPPTRCSPAAATSPATRPARRSRSSRMVAALEKGYPLGYTINAVLAVQVEVHRRRGSPAACPRHQQVLPEERQRQHGRRARTCGAASAARSTRTSCRWRSRPARRTWSTWPSGSASSSARQQDAELANDRSRRPVGRVHPRRLRHHAAGAGQRVRHAGRRRQVLRADPGAGDPRPERQEARRRQPALQAGGRAPRWPAPRSTRPAARSATSPRPRKCDGAHRTGTSRGIVGKPIAGKTGTTDAEKTASLVVMTKQLAVAGILADPDWPQTNQQDGAHDGVNPAVYETLRDAMKGKPRIQFTAAQRQDRRRRPAQHPGRQVPAVDEAESRLSGAGFEVDVDQRPGRLDLPGRHGGRHQPGRPHHQGRRR